MIKLIGLLLVLLNAALMSCAIAALANGVESELKQALWIFVFIVNGAMLVQNMRLSFRD